MASTFLTPFFPCETGLLAISKYDHLVTEKKIPLKQNYVLLVTVYYSTVDTSQLPMHVSQANPTNLTHFSLLPPGMDE